MKHVGEVFVEKQLKQRRLQWLSHVRWMPDHRTQKQLLRCGPQGKRRRPGGTPLHWIDVVSRDLVGIPNWQVHACVLKSVWVYVIIIQFGIHSHTNGGVVQESSACS